MKNTPAQFEAIMTTEEQVLLLAGPGSGKTRTTVARIVKLLADGVAPAEIVALTFTNAAARELEHRLRRELEGKIDPEKFRLGYTGTLHGFAFSMLKRFGELSGYGPRTSIISPDAAASLLASKAKTLGSKTSINLLLARKAEPVFGSPSRVRDLDAIVVASYHDELRSDGIVDFDFLLTEFARLLVTATLGNPDLRTEIRNAFTYLFVDEVQDSARVDWEIYSALPMRWKFFVGDPDQAIYSFRGGAVEELMRFADHPGTHVIKLEENFRSAPPVCAAANRLIAHNAARLAKRTVPAGESRGGTVETLGHFLNEGEEVAAVVRRVKRLIELPASDADIPSVAVLARSNRLAEVFAETLQASGVPVVLRSTSDLPEDWVYTTTLVSLLGNPENDTLAFFHLIDRAINPKLGIGNDRRQATVEAHFLLRDARRTGRTLNSVGLKLPLCRYASDALALLQKEEHGVSKGSMMIAVERLSEMAPDTTPAELAVAMSWTEERTRSAGDWDGVEVLTIHGAKGREFDAVFVVGLEDEVMPGRKEPGDPGIEEERRLAYVAITRARERVFLSSAAQRVTKWRETVSHTPSRFIAEIINPSAS